MTWRPTHDSELTDAAHGFLLQYPAEVAADINAFLATDHRKARLVTTSMTPDAWTFETITVHIDGPVLFAEILAPPMNLLGPELVRDLVSLIQRAEADDAYKVLVFKSGDPDYFISHVDLTGSPSTGRKRRSSPAYLRSRSCFAT